MEFDKICEYFGYFILIVFLILVFCKIFSIQTSVIEGITNKSKGHKSKNSSDNNNQVDPLIDINKNLEAILTRAHDFSRIDKYADEYKTLLSNLSEYVLISLIFQLRVLGTNLSKGEQLDSDQNQKILDKAQKSLYLTNLSYLVTEYINDHNRKNK